MDSSRAAKGGHVANAVFVTAEPKIIFGNTISLLNILCIDNLIQSTNKDVGHCQFKKGNVFS